MKMQQITIAVLLALVLGVPFLMSAGKKGTGHTPGTRTLIIVTPHVPQIRDEFGAGFVEWHKREFNEDVSIDWRTPGGTSEIRKSLNALFKQAIKDNTQGEDYTIDDGGVIRFTNTKTIPFDIFFGGGSFDHGLIKSGVTVDVDKPDGGKESIEVSMSRAADFTQAELDELFGENKIGPQQLYDPDQHWIGTALSSFGIVYNSDVFTKLGLENPTAFDDLTAPELSGWIALADPRQSGSITTTFDSILGNEGWENGWRILRGMCGNTRYFTNSSTKPPIDVSQGEAAAGLAIDFYGRGQAQIIKDSGGGDRVGYTDPSGSVYVDADPVTIVNGCPDYELAARFVRYTLTDEAQGLWQFKKNDPDNPLGVDGEPMGPRWHELRRMPVKRSMYVDYVDYFVDKADPFKLVSKVENPGWRTGVQVMMGCFGIDIANDCRAAYTAINEAQIAMEAGKITSEEYNELKEMFYAFPTTEIQAIKSLPGYEDLSEEALAYLDEHGKVWLSELMPANMFGSQVGHTVPVRAVWENEIRELSESSYSLGFNQDTYRTVRNEWKQPGRQAKLEIEYTDFYRQNYREIVRRVKAIK